jgi:signal transduction histidine kinase
VDIRPPELADRQPAADRQSIRPPPAQRKRDVVGIASYAEDLIADRDDQALREAFVGVLSHELRTPITAIYGGTQLLLKNQMSPTARAAVIGDIAAEAEQLHRLVEDLLAIARIERGVADAGSEPVLLQPIARRAAEAEQRRWPGREVSVLASHDLPAIRGDEGYVTQILRNLISNAVKYSPPSEAVVVALRADHDDHTITVSILDRGAGFPPDIGSDAFRLSYRSPAVAAHMPGTGIGLYVARTLVEAQGGRIWLRNRVDGGAEVGFSLPILELDDAD